MLKNIYLLGTRGIPPKHGAFEQFAHEFSLRCSNQFENIWVQTEGHAEIVGYESNIKLFQTTTLKLPGWPIIYDLLGFVYFIRHSRKGDIAIIFGYTASPFLFLLRIFGRKFIINMDGYEYKRSKFSGIAKIYLRFAEKCAINFSKNIIVDSTDLYTYFLQKYKVKCHLIAYGRDDKMSFNDSYSIELANLLKDSPEYIVSIMRMEPENNFELIVESFLSSNVNMPLILIGPETKRFLKFWKSLKVKVNLSGSKCIYLGGIYNRAILNSIRRDAICYVHGHSVGGMNPVLIESLNFNSIKFCFDTPHNREVALDKGYYFRSEKELVLLFNGLNRGYNNFHIARDEENRFSWNVIINEYLKLIENAL